MTPIIPPTTSVPTSLATPRAVPNPDQLLKTQSQEIYNQGRVRKYTALALFLPPVGLFIAWREKLLHQVVPSLLLAESVLFGLSALISFGLLKPTLSFLKVDTADLSLLNPVYLLLLVGSIAAFALGIIASIYYKQKVHHEGHLHPKATGWMLLILVSHYLLSLILFFYFNSLITPNLENQYQDLQQTQEFLSQ